jgi:hypothetical protein
MKNWKDLTDEELANLTDEEINKYDKLICAEDGIPFLEEPEKPVINYNKENMTVYTVKYSDNMVFTDMEEAMQVMEAINKCSSIGTAKYNYGCKYYEKGFRNYDDTEARASIQSSLMFDETTAKSNYDLRENSRSELNHYEDMKNLYDTSVQKIFQATNDFYNKLNLAKVVMSDRKKLTRLYVEEYLPLAEGNETMAMNFLKKAYTVSEEDEKYINQHKNDTAD